MVIKKDNMNYHIHTETQNLSFIQTSKELRELGVKNHTFFLALYDKDLIFVNPHNPDLSEEIKAKIKTECVRNIYYFLRECVRIPDGNDGSISYLLNRANLASTFCFIHNIDHYLCTPRQTRKSHSVISNIIWACIFGTADTEAVFHHKEVLDARVNIERLKMQQDLLPSYLQIKELVSNDLCNKIVVGQVGKSKEEAENIGRKCNQPIQYFDDVEFIKYVKPMIDSMPDVKCNDVIHCRIFTGFPGDLSIKSARDMTSIVKESDKMSEQMYDLSPDKIKEYAKSQLGIMYIEYSHTLLGKDEEWFKEVSKSLLNDPDKINREILLHREHNNSHHNDNKGTMM